MLLALRKPFYDLRQAFEDFKKEEIACWKIEGRSPLPRDSFVRPSGSLHSPIAHHLHQPSYSTNNLDSDDAETADWTNGCIAMVMGNGFEEGVTFLFDHLHRRSQNSEGYDTYPKVVIQSHERFTHRIGESTEAKVEVIYGAKVKDRIFKRQDRKFTILPLWGPWEGVLLYLDHESNFNNHEEGHKFRRANVFPYHPQKLFYESPDSDVAIGQDLILLAAVKLAGISTPFTEDWYRKRKWRSVIPYLRPTGTRARAVSAMANAKQKRDLSKINIKDMDTIARYSRLRGLNRKISRGERLTVAELRQQADLKTLGTDANQSRRKLREMDVKDMDQQDKYRRKQILKNKIARSGVLTAMDVRQARDLDLQVAFQTLATDASSKPKRKPQRKLRDMDVKDMDKRSKRGRRETLKQKIARSDALTAMDVRQARDLGISIP
jgi:hypothetical protein